MKSFELTDSEYDVAEQWIVSHDCNCVNSIITYSFTITGIGIANVVECSCGDYLNITDYSKW